MTTKDLLHDFTKYLKEKYTKTGLTLSDQLNGILSSAISFALNVDGKERTFRIGVTETDRKLEE